MRLVRLLHHYLVRQTMPASAARHYDRLIEDVADFYFQPFLDHIRGELSGGARVLDIGTGTGQLPVKLALADKSIHVVGIDLSRSCLELATQHAQQAGVADRVTFERVNLEKDKWNVGPVDLIVSTCSLHHWRHPAGVLKAAGCHLRSGARIFLLDYAAEATRQQRSRWIARVREANGSRLLFRIVYGFESRHLAYSRKEMEALGSQAGLLLTDWELLDSPFFVARFEMQPGSWQR